MSQRFLLIEDNLEFPITETTHWWWDTERPYKENEFIAVQTLRKKNANDYVRIEEDMRLLFTDQAEYYAVCPECYFAYSHMQWSGGTNGGRGWRERANEFLEKHQKTKGWCQFCDPVFGSGGWRMDY